MTVQFKITLSMLAYSKYSTGGIGQLGQWEKLDIIALFQFINL